MDYVTAYVHRGYVHQDGGFILQPFITGSCIWSAPCDIKVTPYVTIWNSFQMDGLGGTTSTVPGVSGDIPCAVLHHHGYGASWGGLNALTLASLSGTGTDWYQSEYMAGVFTTWHGLALDLNYNMYAYPTGYFLPVQEVGARLFFDPVSLWREPGPQTPFGCRLVGAVYREAVDKYNPASTYSEAGWEPFCRLRVGGREIGFSLPSLVGMSFANYYTNAQGGNAFLGYYTTGVAVTLPVPLGRKLGCWFLSGSLRYYRLEAYNLRVVDHGSDKLVGKVGVSFAF